MKIPDFSAGYFQYVHTHYFFTNHHAILQQDSVLQLNYYYLMDQPFLAARAAQLLPAQSQS